MTCLWSFSTFIRSFLTQTGLSHHLVYRSSSQDKSKRWRCRSRRSRRSRSRSRNRRREEEGLFRADAVNEVDAERHRWMPAEGEEGRNRHWWRAEEPSFKAGSVKEQNSNEGRGREGWR
jgi:hypothetical protein